VTRNDHIDGAVCGRGLTGVWTIPQDSRNDDDVAKDPGAGGDVQAQIDALVRQLAAQGDDLDRLEARADEANHRADVSEERAEDANHRADVSDARADEANDRADASDARADEAELAALVDREVIADLQREGVLNRVNQAQMEQALASSRIIGAAIGMLMESQKVSYDQAFVAFVNASSRSGHKLHDLAAALVASADPG
jgi:hypothetical protein